MGKIRGNAPSELQAATSMLAPRPVNVIIEPVSISFGPAFDAWVEMYFSRCEAIVLTRSNGVLGFTLEEFRKYVRTLITSRIDYVNSEPYVVGPTDPIVVPTLINLALAGIGAVDLNEVGLKFRPIYTGNRTELLELGEILSAAEMARISQLMEPLAYMGLQFAIGYERDKKGAFDLMAQQYVRNHPEGGGVYSHSREPHPGFAPVAFMLELQQMNSWLGARVVYSDSDTLMTSLRVLAGV